MERRTEIRRIGEAALMRNVAERLAEAGSVEEGLAGVVPLLSQYLGADHGAFVVRGDGEWTVVGRGIDGTDRRPLPRTARLVGRSAAIRPVGGDSGREDPPDSVAVPVSAGRRPLGYGVFRTGADRLPSRGTLRLLDAVGAQVGVFCESVSRGARAREERDRLARANGELAWLLRFSESIHAFGDLDGMFRWLGRELADFAPVHGIELVSLAGNPVVLVTGTPGAEPDPGEDPWSIARKWAEALASRHHLRVPAADFRVGRFPSPSGGASGDPGRVAPAGRTTETLFRHEGRIVGLLTVHVPAGAGDDRRLDRMLAAVADQAGLFLHNCADRERIWSLATHDALTGLLNYRSFRDIFEREFERFLRHGKNLSLLFVDLDHFKGINDAFGHPTGDRVLRKVGEILRSNLRKSDYAFRYGGDEFVVLMSGTDAGKAATLARRLLEAVREGAGGVPPCGHPVSISVGIADCDSLATRERDELLLRADAALYRAKNGGRGRIEVGEGGHPIDGVPMARKAV